MFQLWFLKTNFWCHSIFCSSPLCGFHLQSLLVFLSQSFLAMHWFLPFYFHMCFCLGWRWTFEELRLPKAFSDALVKAPREHYFSDLSKDRLGKVWSGLVLERASWRSQGNHRLQLSISGPVCAHSEVSCVFVANIAKLSSADCLILHL